MCVCWKILNKVVARVRRVQQRNRSCNYRRHALVSLLLTCGACSTRTKTHAAYLHPRADDCSFLLMRMI